MIQDQFISLVRGAGRWCGSMADGWKWPQAELVFGIEQCGARWDDTILTRTVRNSDPQPVGGEDGIMQANESNGNPRWFGKVNIVKPIKLMVACKNGDRVILFSHTNRPKLKTKQKTKHSIVWGIFRFGNWFEWRASLLFGNLFGADLVVVVFGLRCMNCNLIMTSLGVWSWNTWKSLLANVHPRLNIN